MDIALVVILLLISVIVGWYDRYAVQRTYADLYAARHGGSPPLTNWFFTPDTDPEVESWRRRHRNLYLVVTALGVAAIAVLIVRLATTS